jgi:CHAT domain-containing protein
VISQGRKLALISLACIVDGCNGSPSRVDVIGYPLTANVLDAMRGTRPYQLRLDNSHRHLPCSADTSQLIPSPSCITPSVAILRRLTQLASQVSESARKAPTADALWALALLDLSSGKPDTRQLDRAISRLLEVHARDSASASVLNHLAVAHFARASVRGDARDLYAALDDIERAWEHDSVSLAIRFNRAAIHTVLKTYRRGKAEWRLYDMVEKEEAWRTEAAVRERALTTARPAGTFVVAGERIRVDPQTAREFVLDSLLPAWAAARKRGDSTDTRKTHAQINLIAQELLATSGDSSVLHMAREAAPNAHEIVALGTLNLVNGTRHYRATLYASAGVMLAAAVEQLRSREANALADWASLMLGATEMASRRHDAAFRILQSVQRRAAARGDRALEARALLAAGIAIGRAGSMDQAEQFFVRARSIFSTINEVRNVAFMNAALADVQGQTGRSMEAANSSYRSYSVAARAAGSVRYEELLLVAQQLTDEGRLHAAAHVLSEALLAAEEVTRPKDVPETLARLALVQIAMGKLEDAVRTIAEARTAATRVDDPSMASRLSAELNRAEAQVLSASDPRAAMSLIDSARSYFKAIPVEDGALLLSRGRLALQLKDSTSAERDLAHAIRTVRSLAPSGRGAGARQLVSTLRDAHRTLIALALARGDTNRAFSRTVSLPSIDAGDSAGAVPLPPPSFSSAEVRFVVMPNTLLSWVRIGNRRSLVQTAITREELASQIARFINLVRSGDDTAQLRSLGNQLYRTLLAGHDQTLDRATGMDIYADGVIADLPMGVITDDGGQFVVERFAINNVIPNDAPRTNHGKVANRGPLLIGNPLWQRSDFPGLEPLKSADEEIRRIASLYPRHTALSGPSATKKALLEAMPNHNVIHFAGHSRIVVENPGASHIVLSAGKTFGEGVLYASDIAKLDLSAVKLVVLSSCGRTREGAGTGDVNGLVMAFLDAGVDAVVAGLWEVDDEAVVGFTTALHESLSRGSTLDAALKAARLADTANNQVPATKAIGFGTFVAYVKR